MNKALLLSSLLLASAGCAATASDNLGAAQADALETRSQLVDHKFVSTQQFTHTVYDHVGNDWVPRQVAVNVQLSFIPADNYSYDGTLDYEVLVEKVNVATGEVYREDTSYFVKKSTAGSYTFYDCDSSRACNTNEGTTLTANASGTLELRITSDIELFIDERPATMTFAESR